MSLRVILLSDIRVNIIQKTEHELCNQHVFKLMVKVKHVGCILHVVAWGGRGAGGISAL